MTRSQRHLVDTVGYCSRDTVIAQGGLSPCVLPPVLLGLSPDNAMVGDALVDITISGENFDRQSVIVAANVGRRVSYVSPTTLIVQIEPSNVTQPTVVPVVVQTGFYYSDPINFTFNPRPPLQEEAQ